MSNIETPLNLAANTWWKAPRNIISLPVCQVCTTWRSRLWHCAPKNWERSVLGHRSLGRFSTIYDLWSLMPTQQHPSLGRRHLSLYLFAPADILPCPGHLLMPSSLVNVPQEFHWSMSDIDFQDQGSYMNLPQNCMILDTYMIYLEIPLSLFRLKSQLGPWHKMPDAAPSATPRPSDGFRNTNPNWGKAWLTCIVCATLHPQKRLYIHSSIQTVQIKWSHAPPKIFNSGWPHLIHPTKHLLDLP